MAHERDYDEQEEPEVTDDDEPGYCPQCAGSGEGQFDGSRCHACGGSGVERDNSSREDWEASRADERNDARLLGDD